MNWNKKRAILWSAAFLLVGGTLFVALRGCTLMSWNKPQEAPEPVSISITRDFGENLMRSGNAKVEHGDSVMDVLLEVAEVETGYGGGFVNSIDGLGSSSRENGKEDWFYFVNGVMADIGAREYEVEGGDHVWWDYHEWDRSSFIPAVIGSYPRPFSRGYSGERSVNTVLYSDALEDLARETGDYLEGEGATISLSPDISSFEPEKAKGPVMAVITSEDVTRIEWIKEIIDNAEKTGAFLAFQGEEIVPLNRDGEATPQEEDIITAIVSTGSGVGDSSPVWLVLCEGDSGAMQARRLLVTDSEEISMKVGIAVGESGTVQPLPR